MAFREINPKLYKFYPLNHGRNASKKKKKKKKKLEATLLFVDFSKAFDSMQRVKME